ncbi:MAG: hypothetical protein ACLQVD_12235 [Capsulimonadaceae bacterium]
MLNTYIVDQTRFHRANLVSYLTPGDQDYLARHAAMAAGLATHGYSPTAASTAATGLLDHVVQSQAMVMAYNDGFLLLGICFLLASPAIFLLPSGAGGRAGGDSH